MLRQHIAVGNTFQFALQLVSAVSILCVDQRHQPTRLLAMVVVVVAIKTAALSASIAGDDFRSSGTGAIYDNPLKTESN